MRKAQSSIEIVLLISFMALVSAVFLLAINERMTWIQKQKDIKLIEDMGSVIGDEITLALGVEDGYSRTFEIPQTLRGINYSVEIWSSSDMKTNHSELVLQYVNFTKRHETVRILPKRVNGIIYKGKNNITKENGTVCLNECS